MYKTFVIDYNPQTAKMAEAVEGKAIVLAESVSAGQEE
ncbi:hypothetical protein SAMN04487889_1056 [Eubacterium pyruvativorans]|nr:hypothetical protein SAMN04487889_1056 [Eubacterium pyruvativorans]